MITITDIRTWISEEKEMSRLKKEAKRKSLLVTEANNLLQVREFGGKLYICYRDIPIVEKMQLASPLEIAIKNARETYIDYRNDNTREPI